jgi:cellulose synthase/poly-beta-1,6-N-acetylglucosamine synthase-like glycosyltransferase
MASTVTDAVPVAGRLAALRADARRLHWVSGTAALNRERGLTIIAAVLAVASAWPVVSGSVELAWDHIRAGAYLAGIGALGHIALTAVLVYGTLVYLAARLGHLTRIRRGGSAAVQRAISDHEPRDHASIVVLIPAYLEDADVAMRAVLSAALQSHVNNRRVVLLIDDPPECTVAAAQGPVRSVVEHARELLAPARARCASALLEFDARVHDGGVTAASEARFLANVCEYAASWFGKQADINSGPNAAGFFGALTFRAPASHWWAAARSWAAVADDGGADASLDTLRATYVELLDIFSVEITSFERKRFANLSHAANKAMNVNTYLSLLGGAYREEHRDGRLLLVPCAPHEADIVVPEADFALILDADTIIAPDYTTKLLGHFRAPGGESLAVVQSPYSTFPSHDGMLQRIAGAQTDIQYILHQGFTHYDATYWVGANALVRLSALRQLAVRDVERGFEIVKFISDRTLIEDTETTIDLASRGWTLYSHLERLAFSMTPPDFGALLIQRQRWANGGLLIIPKLCRYLWRRRTPLVDRLKEGFMRMQYLIALGPVSMALLIALGVAWNQRLRPGGLFVTGLVYYAMYARDLHLLGYRWYDVVRVVALNVVLIPVNLAGMTASVLQALTGRKARFRRTPKVHGRTRIPAAFVVAEFALLVVWSATSVRSVLGGHLVVSAFMLVHALLAVYAIVVFIGLRSSAADIMAGVSGGGGSQTV